MVKSNSPLTLYHCTQSRGVRVLWTLEELGLDYELVMLPFPPRWTKPQYLEVNPLGTVPLLIDGEARLTESSAIAQYLVSRYGFGDLNVPVADPDYGVYLDFLHHADATLTFPLTVNIRFSRLERHRGLEAAGAAYVAWFAARLVKVERRLEDRQYLCSDRFTVADIAICYALSLARMSGCGTHLSTRLCNYLDAQLARPAYQRALAREGWEAARQGVSVNS